MIFRNSPAAPKSGPAITRWASAFRRASREKAWARRF